MYENMLEKTSNAGLKSILQRLIDMEVNHYDVFKAMKDGKESIEVENLSPEFVNTLLKEVKGKSKDLDGLQVEVKLYQQALELETTSTAKYKELADKAESDTERAQIMQVAAEEEAHQQILRNIIEFITAPGQYLADAEFSVPDDM